METKHILLIRHADVEDYVTDGDLGAKLSEKGWRQTLPLGKGLERYAKRHNLETLPTIHISSALRAQQTLSGMLLTVDKGLAPPKPSKIVDAKGQGLMRDDYLQLWDGLPIHEDIRLIEKHFGGLGELQNYLKNSDEPLKQEFAKFLLEFSKATYGKDPMATYAPLGEADIAVLLRTKDFIRSLWTDLMVEGENHTIAVAHGAVINHILTNWCKLPLYAPVDKKRGLQTPFNTDMIEISGTPKLWGARKVYDGMTGQDCDESVIDHIPRLTASSLPRPEKWVIDLAKQEYGAS